VTAAVLKKDVSNMSGFRGKGRGDGGSNRGAHGSYQNLNGKASNLQYVLIYPFESVILRWTWGPSCQTV